ncbi:type I-U CRISPR-associated RAMP protein Csb1/Cas7u [uncultured Desulfobacter sp.]|uniref:type I-G CRISPR-associated RAMP protein Csb1/Cas7g n=1 Tax=uncultured Desulfobacter sp. TaxID=240139 RepID=UPI002AAC1031|nr:type I-U CRISPR-associated RAMP protein Csb1/Cas7u [uncultured Desulfobacter sp.]
MSLNLSLLDSSHRILFNIPLKPLQGDRFQPTGFPSLGAATYQTPKGTSLLVESAQSMANRLEATIWDEARQQPVEDAAGISYIRVERNGQFLTSSILEAHRINSPYLLEGADKKFFDELKKSLGGLAEGPIDRKLFARTLFKYDVNTLIHGVFLAKKDLAGGRLRIARALSAFVEADGVELAASGGVKNDHVNPSGDTAKGFGNVPFARDEYTAGNITLYVNIDLDQIRGYGLEKEAESLLILLSLYKVRALLSGALRFRTACDLSVAVEKILAVQPGGFVLPEQNEIAAALKKAVAANGSAFLQTVVQYNDKLAKGKAEESEELQ